MEEFKKYDLTPIGNDVTGYYATHNIYVINGLDKVYVDPKEKDLKFLFNGACGLIKNPAYPGYCSLCTMHREDNSSYHFGDATGVTYEYAPLYNKDGQRILVKYDRDELFADIMEQRVRDGGYGDYRLTTWINGTGNMWDKED